MQVPEIGSEGQPDAYGIPARCKGCVSSALRHYERFCAIKDCSGSIFIEADKLEDYLLTATVAKLTA